MNANGIDFKTCYLSDSGVFIKNKGCFVYQELEHFAFWLVVDGVDFVPEKESAELVVDQLCADLVGHPTLSRSHIRKCLNKAHLLLKNASIGIVLKASLVLVITDYSEIIWAVSGNSRMYLIRERQLAFRSRDQSVAQSLVESDIIDEDGMTNVADRDILTNYLGIEFGFAPFISNRFQLQDGDILILCNLGFWEQIHSETFNQLLRTIPEPAELLPILKKQFLAQENQALNNYVVGLIAAKRILHHEQSVKFRLDPKQAVIILTVLLSIGGLIVAQVVIKTKFQNENQLKTVQTLTRKNTIIDYEKKGDQLVKESKYTEATAEYDQALNILSNYTDKGTEAAIRLKTSIILMLKDGDDFLVKQQYENALNRYKAAQNFDAPNYFHMQIENKIANVSQLLNAQRTRQAAVAKSKPQATEIKQNNHVNNIPKPKPILTIPNQAERNGSVSGRLQTNKVAISKKVTNKNKPNKPGVSEKETYQSVATPDETNKTVAKKTVIQKSDNNDTKLKPISTGSVSSLPSKTTSKPTAAISRDHGKPIKAAGLVEKGDKLLIDRKFRDAIRCYKKAKSIYQKSGMTAKTAQLDEKIEATKKKMRHSFEGAH
jgi:serine/threonine protein phosphatase PrpC